MLGEKPVHIFTDHRNLLFFFAPQVRLSNVFRHVISKVQQWAMYVSRFPFCIENRERHCKVFADMLMRLVKGYRSEQETIATGKICSLLSLNDKIGLDADEIEWPDIADIKCAQQTNLKPVNVSRNDDDI